MIGGVQANPHHLSNAAMTDHNTTISDNHVTNIGSDCKEAAAILSTYVTGATIIHNQVDHLPYDAIDVGWGWGINDPGGSQDYVNCGTYNYQPIYTTPTTLKNSHTLLCDTCREWRRGERHGHGRRCADAGRRPRHRASARPLPAGL